MSNVIKFIIINLNMLKIKASDLDNLSELDELNVVEASIATWPLYMSNFPNKLLNLLNLNKLLVCNLYLYEVPECIDILCNLTELELCHNKFKTIPTSIYNLTKLTKLNLEYNPLEYLPNGISKLQNLKSIVLTKCNLSYLPEDFIKIKTLKSLHMWRNNVKYLPKNIFIELCKLKYIGLNDNPIIKIPSGISKLKNIKQVDFANILGSAYPDDFIDFDFSRIFMNFGVKSVKTDKLFTIEKCDKDIINTLQFTAENLLIMEVNFNIENLPHNIKKILLINTPINYITKIPFGCEIITYNHKYV